MAIILCELNEDVEQIVEASTEGTKSFKVNGIFMQTEQGNRNGRIYPKHLMEREVTRYVKEYVDQNRALGELSHPSNRVSIDPERASHLITKLQFDGNNVVGEAKVLDTPMGKIVKALMSEDVRVGVSSRALGSVKQLPSGLNEVQADFSLKTVDIVTDPSAHDAWITAIMENKEWTLVEGIWTERNIQETKSNIRKATKAELNEKILDEWNKFMNSFRV